MGKLMKDVPATRYSLLDRPSPVQRRAEQLKNFAEDAQPDIKQSGHVQSRDPLLTTVAYRPRRSAHEELEAYMQSAYRPYR